MKKIIISMFVLFISLLQAQDFKLAGGGGYKKPIMKIIKIYEKKTGKQIEPIFGNIKQISMQTQNSDIALIIGDKKFLQTKSGLKIAKYIFLGNGHLVIAFAKGIRMNNINDLKNSKIQKIVMPQPQKTGYGTAGMQFLHATKLYKNIKDKLYIVSAMPQAANYVASGNVDAGVLNLTSALIFKKELGGYIKINKSLYKPINIVAGELPNCKQNDICRNFVKFLMSKKSKKIFKQYGM